MIGPLVTLLMTEARRIWCFKWLVATVAIVAWLASATWVQRLPDVYDAWGQIYVDQQPPLVAATQGVSLVGNGYGSPYVVQTILLNDDNLEKIVLRMDPSMALEGRVAMARAVNDLRRQIRRAPDPGDGFIEFHVTDSDPVRARDIARLLIDQFIFANTDRNQRDLARAGQFLDDQIASYNSMLSASRAKLAEFRRAHPAVASLAASTGGPVYTERAGVAEPPPTMTGSPPPPTAQVTQAEARVAELEARLASLRTTYTDQYPDVATARRQLSEAIAAREAARSLAATRGSPATSQRTVAWRGRLGPRVLPTPDPEVAAAWADLQRSDEVLRANYQQLIAKLAATRMSQAVYGGDEAGKYQVVRSPTVPVLPVGPNRLLYLALAGAASLGVGVAAGYLRAATKGVLISTYEVEQAFQLPVIGTVSWEPAWHVERLDSPARSRGLRSWLRRSGASFKNLNSPGKA